MERIFTAGHSNRSLEDFIALLRDAGVAQAIDIRRYPASRKWPHFNAEALAASLPEAGIAYVPLPALGGRRRANPDSRHTAWKSETFRAYADFLETPDARAAIAKLEEAARDLPSAFFCAEAVPWRCHRSLVADALTARGWDVTDLIGPGSARPHVLPGFARVAGTEVIYDVGGDRDLPLE
jgi:uncharacterized protein (DUF488 family)